MRLGWMARGAAVAGSLAVGGAVALALAAGAAAAITTTTVDVDSLAPGTAVSQYPSSSPEITFGFPDSFGFTLGSHPADGVVSSDDCGGVPRVEAVSATHTAPNALQLPSSCGPVEFPYYGAFAALTDTANRVSAYVGDPLYTPTPFVLDVYDVNRKLLDSKTFTTSAAAVTTPISITEPSYDIAYVALYLPGQAEADRPIGFDDLSVTSGGDQPRISLSSSAGGHVGQGSEVHYPVTVVRHNGSSGDVTLAASGLPSGVHASFSPATLTGTTTASRLTIWTDAGAPLGPASGTITATPQNGAAGSKPDSVSLPITIERPFQVTLGLLGNLPSHVIDMTPCSSAGEQVQTTLAPGFAGTPVKLSADGSDDAAGSVSVSLPDGTLQNPADFDSVRRNIQTLRVSTNAHKPAGDIHVQIAPSSGSFAEPPATLTIHPVPPSITSVSTTNVFAPQALKPGTEVKIHGYGFCPGDTTVAFGDSGPLPPDYVDPSGTWMTVATPLSAGSGPLTVTSGGQDAGDAPTLTVRSYRNDNGYRFKNSTTGPATITLDQMKAAFGSDQVDYTINPCFPVAHCDIDSGFPTINNRILLALYNALLDGKGTCFGIAVSSVRFVLGKLLLTDYPGGRPGGSVSELSNGPQGPSGPLQELLNATLIQQLSTEFISSWLGEVSSNAVNGGAATARKVRSQVGLGLQAGTFPEIALRDGASLIKGHVVTAYNVEPSEPDGSYDIDVYDSNMPPPDGPGALASRIHMSTDGHWELPSTGYGGGAGDIYVFQEGSVPRQPTLPDDSGALQSLVLFAGTSAATQVRQVTDAAGKTLFTSTGAPNRGPSALKGGVVPNFDAAPGSGTDDPLVGVLGDRGPLRFVLASSARGRVRHDITGPGFVAEVSTTTAPGDRATLQSSAADRAVSFTAADHRAPVTVQVAAHGAAGTQSATLTTSSPPGATTGIAVSKQGVVTIAHRGPAETVRIALSSEPRQGMPGSFVTGPLTVGTGRSLTLTAIRWRKLAGSAVIVARGHARRALHSSAGSPVRIVRASERLRRTSAAFTTIARSRISAPATAVFSWVIRRGHRIVARHVTSVPVSHGGLISRTWTTRRSRRLRGTLSSTVLLLPHAPHGTPGATSRSIRVRS